VQRRAQAASIVLGPVRRHRVAEVLNIVEVTDGQLDAGTGAMRRIGFDGVESATSVTRGWRQFGHRSSWPGRPGALSLVAALVAGGSHIDHADRLRAGATHTVLPFRVTAPSTLGTFFRA
jgi:hypothetical protein